MFGDYAVHALWSDTTAMDSLRYAGAVESVPTTCTASTCYHVPTNYQNNDTDNQARADPAPAPDGRIDSAGSVELSHRYRTLFAQDI